MEPTLTPLATPSKLSPRERERRALRGGGSRSAPAPLLVPALVAVAFVVVPLAGLVFRAPWGHAWSTITIPFSPTAVIMAETFVAMPFLVVTSRERCGPQTGGSRRQPQPWARSA
ncbi:MAG: molybdate transport system permease protein [Kribbellaceae bacterium]|nr:molybdate transport system permease protein [Kribbellaceae bacterium]